MGVTLGKRKEPTSKFRQAAKGVIQINNLQKDSPINQRKLSTNQQTVSGMRSSLLTNHNLENGQKSAERPQSRQTSQKIILRKEEEEKNNEENYDNHSRALIFKDTSSAWEALMRGETMESELPNTELVVVDSALGGFQTVERVNVSERDMNHQYNDVTRSKVKENEEEDYKLPYELPIDWETQVMKLFCFSFEDVTGHACRRVKNRLSLEMSNIQIMNNTTYNRSQRATPSPPPP